MKNIFTIKLCRNNRFDTISLFLTLEGYMTLSKSRNINETDYSHLN